MTWALFLHIRGTMRMATVSSICICAAATLESGCGQVIKPYRAAMKHASQSLTGTADGMRRVRRSRKPNPAKPRGIDRQRRGTVTARDGDTYRREQPTSRRRPTTSRRKPTTSRRGSQPVDTRRRAKTPSNSRLRTSIRRKKIKPDYQIIATAAGCNTVHAKKFTIPAKETATQHAFRVRNQHAMDKHLRKRCSSCVARGRTYAFKTPQQQWCREAAR